MLLFPAFYRLVPLSLSVDFSAFLFFFLRSFSNIHCVCVDKGERVGSVYLRSVFMFSGPMMERTLPALPSLQIPPPHLRSCKISKVSPLGLLHRPPSCQLRVKSFSRGAVKIQWRQLMGSSPCPPSFVCLLGVATKKENKSQTTLLRYVCYQLFSQTISHRECTRQGLQ
jgi:hypothetical protein